MNQTDFFEICIAGDDSSGVLRCGGVVLWCGTGKVWCGGVMWCIDLGKWCGEVWWCGGVVWLSEYQCLLSH